ncbi:MAG: META domain-containing protein [Bacteroidota bacterium]|nr:META domain-containing protein [Bacteroidota bacterium]MDX5431218.1 META domain-containing protein [Bacteroidota bacterium]MDX5469957.1 META domain-containing protein [Bacteroidota bacterium]
MAHFSLITTLFLSLSLFVPACKSYKSLARQTDQIGVVQMPLSETHWLLFELEGKVIPLDTTGETQAYLEITPEKEVIADDGCNRLTGKVAYTDDGKLEFGPLISSMRACPGQTLEAPFRRALKECDRYVIQGSVLSLMQGKKKILARFQAG